MSRAKQIMYAQSGALRGKYLTEEDCVTLDRVIQADKQSGIVQDLVESVYNLSKDQIDYAIMARSTDDLEMPLGRLRPYQSTCVAFMYFAKMCLLGDSVGLGKTVETSALINLVRSENYATRYMVVTDKTVVPQYQRELIKLTGEFVDIVYGKQDCVRPYLEEYYNTGIVNSILCNSSIFKSKMFMEWILKYREEHNGKAPFNILIADECSYMGNSRTETYKNAEIIRDGTEYRIGMNATPFETNLMMFYNQLNFLDPTLLPTKTAFIKRYCIQRRAPYAQYSVVVKDKYKNQEEFRDLIKYRYFSRGRNDLGARFEDCTSDIILVPLSAEQQHMLPRTSSKHMLYDNPSYFMPGLPFTGETSPKAAVVKDLLTSGTVGLDKVKVEGDWDKAETVLVYTLYKESQQNLSEFLTNLGISNRVMNGDTPQAERDSIINDFKNAHFRVLLTNVMKGLNFGGTDHIIIYTVPGNVNNIVQFEGRSFRDFDIVGKHLVIISTEGSELERLTSVISQRALASTGFAGGDFSLVMKVLTDPEYEPIRVRYTEAKAKSTTLETAQKRAEVNASILRAVGLTYPAVSS